MKSFTNINIHFCDACNPQQKSINEVHVKKVIKTYQEEGLELEEEVSILFLFAFNGRSIQYPCEFGFVVAKATPEYSNFIKENACEVKKLRDFSSYGYIVYLSRIIAEDESEISRVLTISHEVRHIVQDIGLENSHLKDIVLKKYLRMRCLNYFNEVYRNMPAEIDAFRESKRIAIRIYGEDKVEAFLNEEIDQHRDRMVRTCPDSPGHNDEIEWLSYWEHLKSINIKDNYDFRSEFQGVWKMYGPLIEEEVGRIRLKQEDERIDLEKSLLEAYGFLISPVRM